MALDCKCNCNSKSSVSKAAKIMKYSEWLLQSVEDMEYRLIPLPKTSERFKRQENNYICLHFFLLDIESSRRIYWEWVYWSLTNTDIKRNSYSFTQSSRISDQKQKLIAFWSKKIWRLQSCWRCQLVLHGVGWKKIQRFGFLCFNYRWIWSWLWVLLVLICDYN